MVWPGKTTEVERVSLPFQTIERVNEVSRSAAGQARLRDGGELPDWWPEGWRNKLIWGDNKYVLSSLLDEFAGKVDLIYIDPPFATGADFSIPIEINGVEIDVPGTTVELTAYRDTWHGGIGSYSQMLYDRLVLLRELLAPHGSIFVHADYHVGHYIKLVMDEVFGVESFTNELIWYYRRWTAKSHSFQNMHDTIFFYRRTPDVFRFNYVEQEPTEDTKRARDRGWNANTYRAKGGRRRQLLIYDHAKFNQAINAGTIDPERYDRVVDATDPNVAPNDVIDPKWEDVLEESFIGPRSGERVGYPTQKPERLIDRLVAVASDPGDLVLDCFCGGGTTPAVAQANGRRWIAADLGRFAVQTTRKRLLNTIGRHPFEVLNLGRYERSHWQGADVGERIGEYYDFIIQLYGATRLDGFNHLHGIKGDRMIHVGATDAPVTVEELDLAISECAEGSTLALDVLGWEWEMGLNPSRKDELAHFYEVDVHLLNIPREVMDQKAVEAGDIHFFELSVVELEQMQDDRGLVVEITNFLPAVDHYMAEKVGDAISQWSDWIDYWSIDFDYNGETFINSWQSYRTRQDRSLSLTCDPHSYDEPGKKTIVVKVIDIFGNDTTRELTVEVE